MFCCFLKNQNIEGDHLQCQAFAKSLFQVVLHFLKYKQKIPSPRDLQPDRRQWETGRQCSSGQAWEGSPKVAAVRSQSDSS